MAQRSRANFETQHRRLKLKSEQLNLKVKVQEHKDKLREVTQQLKTIGGRVR